MLKESYRDFLVDIANGATIRELAINSGKPEATLRSRSRKIKDKLNAQTLAQAVVLAIWTGDISLESDGSVSKKDQA